MPLSLQAKLLRVLQERKVTPVGGQRDIDVDVRVLATSNRDMAHEVNQSRFREDLYYRLNVFPLKTSNLSSRKDDILPIAIKILDKHNQVDNSVAYLTNEARDLLLNHNWPGNVRELRNLIERVAILANNNPEKISMIIKESIKQETSGILQEDNFSIPLKEARENFEKDYLTTQLKKFGGNVSKTAKFVGMERSALHRKLKDLGVKDLN